MGVVAATGVGKKAFWDGMSQGKNYVDRITLYDPSPYPSQVAAEIKNFNPADHIEVQEVKRCHRQTPYAIAATQEALLDAGFNPKKLSDKESEEIGIIFGTAAGGLGFAEQQIKMLYEDGIRKMSPFTTTGTFVGMTSSDISLFFGIRGISVVVSTGCTSANDAVGYALNYIRSGMSDILISGGSEACITPAIVGSFARCGAVSTKWNHDPKRASRPFNIDRDGFVMGEGGWVFVMEELEHARKRGAKIYGEVAGYGATCDAYHKTAPEPTGRELCRAIKLALQDAQTNQGDVDYISLHGTSTVLNDKTESTGIKLCFGDQAYSIPASSFKSMIGHPQGASGAAGIVLSALSMENNFLTPTINYENPDPECDLDYIPNKGREKKLRNIVCNSIGFGSKNSIIILKKLGA